MSDYIIQADHLTKKFTLDAGFFAKNDRFVYAVNDVSFGIERGKTYGLVGESGCGKTTSARMLVRMYKADGGAIYYRAEGQEKSNVLLFNRKQLRDYREKIKYVFQDPSRSLNPRMTVFNILTASYKYSSIWPGKKIAYEEASQIMEEVGLDPLDLEKRPSEFSGGQRQRISIARALIMKPQVMFCDEVVSALDVSVQSQILNLLQDIREKRGISFLFIAHDLRVSCYFCDTIGVMYRGLLVEEAPASDLYKSAAHPYTKLLFSGSDNSASNSNGEVKTTLESLHGCPFAHRCPQACEKCKNQIPEWREIASGHKVRCWVNF
ncbi:ABC transporter ATP-binding protein [Treponema ruminis]|uniref:Oligopeptide/dipeptide ABC transporter ATP-binding protein n=1 Tax=Treponema ruminis TaxID=744515 RepID=A0A7W8G9E5_9SPIR|nr:ABC transporter ATP-binding protein [Treponema ruminis]MBB5226260.1 oligopeptide/dipeptide ABC transporter ATP-binding protein [Treponema ruminis]QSI02833.1 ABC transporter ATP-binding protein [Treponema ruminis]